MSLRLEMLQVARLAQKQLSEVRDLISNFLQKQLNEDGGFKDRSGKSDLYYTVFALECLHALQLEIPSNQVKSYLRTFGDGENLDLVHLSCLVRCWACVSEIAHLNIGSILGSVCAFRTEDLGFNVEKNAPYGSSYADFLVVGIYQDLQQEIPIDIETNIVRNINNLEASDGGYSNIPGMKTGSTPATAAAVAVLRTFSQPIPKHIGMWLLNQCSPQGGFCAAPEIPIPDLLSTATALHALTSSQTNFTAIIEPCLDFVDSLWTNRGGFYGNWTDEILDSEYTYYGLLALGHLSI